LRSQLDPAAQWSTIHLILKKLIYNVIISVVGLWDIAYAGRRFQGSVFLSIAPRYKDGIIFEGDKIRLSRGTG